MIARKAPPGWRQWLRNALEAVGRYLWGQKTESRLAGPPRDSNRVRQSAGQHGTLSRPVANPGVDCWRCGTLNLPIRPDCYWCGARQSVPNIMAAREEQEKREYLDRVHQAFGSWPGP
jgi:hypothetical protein